MRIIISPTKKMRVDTDTFSCKGLPPFMDKTAVLLDVLKTLDREELKRLWGCSDKLVEQNMERLHRMEPEYAQTPAILAYEGIQFQYMAPAVFTEAALDYVQDHLRILSGFYGMVRPFDAITPYRLEMQSKLRVGETRDLYGFWEDLLACSLYRETDCVINLASKEYSRCVDPFIPKGKRFITCGFTERKNGKLVEKGTLCKMARGEMVRYLAESGIISPEQVKNFSGLGYRFSAPDSTENHFIFIKEDM